MNHPYFEDQLAEFFDGELAESRRAEVEAHLSGCEECRVMLERWSKIKSAFISAPVGRSSAEFIDGVMDRLAAPVEQEQDYSRKTFPGLKWLMPALGYAFALTVMFFAIAGRQPIYAVNTENMLLSDIPQKSQWAFSAEIPEPEQGKLIEV